MIWIVLAFVAFLTAWFYFLKPLSYWKNKGVKQSKPWPVIGDSWRLMGGKPSFLDYINWMYDVGKGDRYFGLYELSRPVLCLMDPELIKRITIKEFDSCSDHDQFYVDPKVDPCWGNILLNLRGQRWKQIRSTLSPSFTGNKLRMNYDSMAETADGFINYFLNKNQDFIELEMKNVFSRYTNDVIASTAFGVKVDSLQDQDNTFYYNGLRLTNFQSFLTVLKLILLKFAPITWKIFGINLFDKEQINYFQNVLFESMKQREENSISRPDLVNILMEAKKERENKELPKNGEQRNKSMTDDEIFAQAIAFFGAGFDTVSSTLSFGAYELALNKDVQNKLREEIKEMHNKHGKPSFDVIQEMKFMDMVVSEILRKWPSVMFTDRLVTKPFTVEPVNKNEVPVLIEPGNVIFVPIYRLQRDPQYFPNPDKFDPERFSEENKHNIKPCTYMPFGSGPRACIGNRFALLEIKCLLFNILLNYEIVQTKKTQIPPKLNSPNFQYTMDGGFWLGLKRVKA